MMRVGKDKMMKRVNVTREDLKVITETKEHHERSKQYCEYLIKIRKKRATRLSQIASGSEFMKKMIRGSFVWQIRV